MKEKATPPAAEEPLAPRPEPSLELVPPNTRADTLSGVFVAGTVLARRRTPFPQKGGGIRYNIALGVLTTTGRQVVERWSSEQSPPGLPTVGEHICVPVTLQHFATKNGTGTRLLWGSADRGEAF